MKRFSKIIGIMCILLLISNVVYADTPMVVLDAGHGGADSGAISLDGEYLEKYGIYKQQNHVRKLWRNMV